MLAVSRPASRMTVTRTTVDGAAARGSGDHRSSTATAVRPEIQALRALAVGLVVAYHLWPQRLTGGFVGVDVFFVISGFLITGHLLRDAARTGSVRVLAFWARRLRRLLPASLLVLLVSAIATRVLVSPEQWQQFYREIAASTLYVQNWVLANDSIDYLAADNSASPVQHYWSLSVEEQFYFVWPLVLIGAFWLAGRVTRFTGEGARRRAASVTLGIITIASLVFSVVATAVSPASAYFITPTRAWEFGAGGLLALVAASPLAGRIGLRSVVSWLGLAAIVASAVLYSGHTPFPGYTAMLPVAGTLAVIWAGAPRHPLAPTAIAKLGPVQWLGDQSYSLYLWHWPLIVLVPVALGRDLTTVSKLVVLGAALVLAWVTKVGVEDPVRRARILAGHRPRRTIAATAVGMVIVLAIPVSGLVSLQQRSDEAARVENLVLKGTPAPAGSDIDEQLRAGLPGCYGALARETSPTGCPNPQLAGLLVPDPATADERTGFDRCLAANNTDEFLTCDFGTPAASASTSIVLLGDSHTRHLLAPFVDIAKALDWHVYTVFKGSCPFTTALRDDSPAIERACGEWQPKARDFLAQHPDISVVVTSASSRNHYKAGDAGDSLAEGEAGARAAWSGLPSSVKNVVVVRDVPRPDPSTLECVVRAYEKGPVTDAACATPRQTALLDDPLATAAADYSGATLVDLTDTFCTTDDCLAVMGNATVYRDEHHLSDEFARSLAPLLYERLAAAGIAPGH